MDLRSSIQQLAAGQDLSRKEMQDVMNLIMHGEATPSQIGAFLTALMIKGETVEEIVGAATIMRSLAARVETRSDHVVDTVGTGGDGARLFNVSTASALVASAAGAAVAKHGNRAATGTSGSADALEAAGVNITLTPEEVGRCVDEVGIGFMFAPTHHGATRHAIGPRREIGVRTIFNLLGPLTNPAGARYQLVGVFAEKWVVPLAEVFGALGSRHTLVICSEDGTDEISLAAPTLVAELSQGKVTSYRIAPEDFGIRRQSLDGLMVRDAEHSLALIRETLTSTPGAASDMVALNAGATLYAADFAETIQAGVELAREVMSTGAAMDRLNRLAEFSRQFKGDS